MITLCKFNDCLKSLGVPFPVRQEFQMVDFESRLVTRLFLELLLLPAACSSIKHPRYRSYKITNQQNSSPFNSELSSILLLSATVAMAVVFLLGLASLILIIWKMQISIPNARDCKAEAKRKALNGIEEHDCADERCVCSTIHIY